MNGWLELLTAHLGREPTADELDKFCERVASAWAGVPEPKHCPNEKFNRFTGSYETEGEFFSQ